MNRLTLSFLIFTLACAAITASAYLIPVSGDAKLKTSMKLQSSAFGEDQSIPSTHTCDGQNSIPPLSITDVPKNSQSLAIVMEDPDSPSGNFTHWLIWNLPPQTTNLDSIPPIANQGVNDFGELGYDGPCPKLGTHHYNFTLYALDTATDLPDGSTKTQLFSFMKDHILSQTSLTGTYKRQ